MSLYKELRLTESILIEAKADKLWDALTKPEIIKVYMFGTHATTDWAPGSPIVFAGEYDGQKYQDKGRVIENKKNDLLSYSYWSGFSGLEDKEENYCLVEYQIEQHNDKNLKFSWTQVGFASEEARSHTKEMLNSILQKIKEIVEQK